MSGGPRKGRLLLLCYPLHNSLETEDSEGEEGENTLQRTFIRGLTLGPLHPCFRNRPTALIM